ncbi:MAG: hypothetical protein FWE94_08555 [Coriobacteriia bacterium]|nr:hypothetical protein [Coriobacteriia bacterium]
MAIDGAYEAKVKAPIGSTKMKLVLATSGEALTGTVASKKGETEIRNGVANGNEFTFDFDMSAPMGKTEVAVKGTVEGDEIKGFVTTPLGTVSMSGVRV